MISLEEIAVDCNAIPTAKADKRKQERLQRAAAWKGAEVHYYNPEIAKQYGREGAIVLRGLGWKINRAKHMWDGQKAYYETLEDSVTHRFPYFSTGGLWGITDYLANDAKVLKRGENNKMRYDRTTWYSMSPEVITQVLEEDGDLGFDVRVMITDGLPEALAYHHVQYHGAKTGEAWHKVNKSALARSWGMDRKTVISAFSNLVTEGILTQNPHDEQQYGISRGVESSNETVELANEKRLKRGVELANETVESANKTVESANKTVECTNETVESSNNDTYYTVGNPLEDHYNRGRAPLKEEVCQKQHSLPVHQHSDNMMNMTSSSVHGSATVLPTQQHQRLNDTGTVSSHKLPVTFSELKDINQQLIPAINKFIERVGQVSYDEWVFSMCDECVYSLPPEIVDQYIAAASYKRVMAGILERFRGTVETHLEQYSEAVNTPKEELFPLIYYPGLEILTRAFQMDDVWASRIKCTVDGHSKLVDQLSDGILEKRVDDAGSSIERKLQIFKEAVELRNKHGWLMADETEVKNAVCLTEPYLKAIGRIFTLNPHLAPWALVSVLWDCVEWSRKVPEQPERHYWSRQGTDLGTFSRKLNLIVQELGMREECPVAQL
jgi:hypothetical protein